MLNKNSLAVIYEYSPDCRLSDDQLVSLFQKLLPISDVIDCIKNVLCHGFVMSIDISDEVRINNCAAFLVSLIQAFVREEVLVPPDNQIYSWHTDKAAEANSGQPGIPVEMDALFKNLDCLVDSGNIEAWEIVEQN